MTGVPTRLPGLPRSGPTLTCGVTATGSEVLDGRIVVREGAPAGPVIPAADGVWEAVVPAAPVPLSDFLTPGEDARLDDDGWRAAGTALVDRLTAVVASHPVLAKRHLLQIALPPDTTRRNLRNLAQGLVTAGRPAPVTRQDPGPAVRDIHVDLTGVTAEVAEVADRELRAGEISGAATALARDLDGLPDGVTTADWWAREAKALTGGLPGTRVKVHRTPWLERKGFGGLLSVCTDPVTDAGLVEYVWDPAAAAGELTDDRPDAVVVGGAVVPALIRALARLGGTRKVVGLVPVTGVLRPPSPPRPGRPPEVVEHHGGLTTRLTVTGDGARQRQLAARLALGDTLAYAATRHRPDRIYHVGPTSTAAAVALGARTGALFTPDAALARRLTLRGAKVGERWWPMPLPEDVDRTVTARSADLTGEPAGPPALTAALWLHRFVGNVPFVHLDTTGPAVTAGPEAGPTGFAARSLVEWLRK